MFVRCAIDECRRRDPKGLYAKADAGGIGNFTGVSSGYEEPAAPEVVIDSDKESIEQSAMRILRWLKENGVVPDE